MFSAPDQQRGPTPHDQTRPYLGTPCEKPPSPAWRSTACLRRRTLWSKLKRPKTHGDHSSQTHARRVLRRKTWRPVSERPRVTLSRGGPRPEPIPTGIGPGLPQPQRVDSRRLRTQGARQRIFNPEVGSHHTPPPSRPILRPVAPAGLHSTAKKYGNVWFWYGGLGEVTVGGYPPNVAAARSRRAGRIVRATDKSTF